MNSTDFRKFSQKGNIGQVLQDEQIVWNNGPNILKYHHMTDTAPSAFCLLTSLTFATNSLSKHYHFPHSTGQESEIWKSSIICPKLTYTAMCQSQGWNPRCLALETQFFNHLFQLLVLPDTRQKCRGSRWLWWYKAAKKGRRKTMKGLWRILSCRQVEGFASEHCCS